MEELTNNLSANLNLTEIETKIHSFAEPFELPEDENREEPSAFLAVKLLTTRHFNPEAFKKRLKEMWPERFSINVLEKEPNFFTVEFGCFGDRKRVLIRQPWHFDFKLIVMSPLEAGSVVTAEMLTSTPFWIQVSGIPFLERSRALAIKLGEVLGRTRTRLRPHVTHPVSLAPPSLRPPSNHIISEPSFNDPPSEYGVQYLHQPRTTPVGCYMTQVPHKNTFIHDINGSNVVPPFSAWPTSSNVVDLDSPAQSRRSVPPSAYPMLHDQNINTNNSMSVPEQVAPSSLIVAAPAITNANFSDATGYTVPVSQAFATIMADLNANQLLHFAVGSSSSPATASTSGRRYKPKRPPSINEIEFHYFGSDHRPLILNLHQLHSTQRHSNRFFFDKLWMAEPNFEVCLTQAWSSNHQSHTNNPIVNLAEKLKHCSKQFTEWKKSLGPSISSKIKEIQHTLKQSWHCRNEFLHHQKRINPALMIQSTSDYLNLYQQNNMNSAAPGAHHSLLEAAPHGELPNYNLKLTVDVAQDIHSNMTGFGLALFNSEGNMLLSVSKPWTGTHSALQMEAHALTYALSWCNQQCIQPDLIVSDCKNIKLFFNFLSFPQDTWSKFASTFQLPSHCSSIKLNITKRIPTFWLPSMLNNSFTITFNSPIIFKVESQMEFYHVPIRFLRSREPYRPMIGPSKSKMSN
ncbi:hypothetical protein F8388_004250 [Cannabis sativa]|uniref:DUF4283 domain-containing protein n=1 Tax=Cannabis sativa TaxID=3483 RepID=A0A7J6F7E9_CANSA|nr:hypothetical protein F8388_004250 [Cannabis sativa]